MALEGASRHDRRAADTAPKPLAAPDALRVWLRFVRLNRRLHGAMTAELKAARLSISQFDLLSTLSEAEGLSQQDLADRLYVTKGNVSGLVDRLVASGLVERRPLAGDRRSHALCLTALGRETVGRGLAIQRTYVSRTLGALAPADIAALDRVLGAWRDRLRQDGSGSGRKSKGG
ncbi:MarR family winged helix-turn-helix transcriptional regulator [Chelatococcus reniformis]|uniref:Transcriptional regulator n=1 Tax=Chelatococcus reniformis TaxID=1494448 RepID=A0A916U6K4_9HYPH|nr:MarR family transcriptional regulator [Chelatococcus reniformis]GGC60538.1 transcriptional regulator [Chelatococcus reniformis]